jgi:hypothetical protein
MNKSELNAYNWLISEGYKQIKFNPNTTPDFTTLEGNSFEVKTPINRTITFSSGQVPKLLDIKGSSIILFDETSKTPLSMFQSTRLKTKPYIVDGYHIIYGDKVKRSIYEFTILLKIIDESINHKKIPDYEVLRCDLYNRNYFYKFCDLLVADKMIRVWKDEYGVEYYEPLIDNILNKFPELTYASEPLKCLTVLEDGTYSKVDLVSGTLSVTDKVTGDVLN